MTEFRASVEGSALRTAATGFSEKVEELGLAALLRAYGGSGIREKDILRDRPTFSEELGGALDLLCLSRPVPAREATAMLTSPMLDHLAGIGAASVSDGHVRLPDIRLIDHYGRLNLVGISNFNQDGYFENEYGYYGHDSVGLGRLLVGARGRALDVCSSTGCQAALMAATATEVTTVEIDTRLKPLFETNMYLSGCRAKVDAQWCDLRDAEFDAPFDSVAVNAPMMPTFGVLDLPMTGGGPDGARLLETVLRKVPLARHGRLVANAMIPGDAKSLQVEWLRRLGEERGWSVTVIPTDQEMLAADSPFVRSALARFSAHGPGVVETVMHKAAPVLAANSIDRLYFGFIVVTAGSGTSFGVASTELQGRRWQL